MFASFINETLSKRTSIGDNDELWSAVLYDAEQSVFAFNPRRSTNKCTVECILVDCARRRRRRACMKCALSSMFTNKVDSEDKQWSVTCDVCHQIYLFHSRPYFTVITSTKRNLIILMMIIMKTKIKSLELPSNTLTQLDSSILIYQIYSPNSTKLFAHFSSPYIDQSTDQFAKSLFIRIHRTHKEEKANLQINLDSPNVQSLDLSSLLSTHEIATSIKQLNSLTIRFFLITSLLDSAHVNSRTLLDLIANHLPFILDNMYVFRFHANFLDYQMNRSHWSRERVHLYDRKSDRYSALIATVPKRFKLNYVFVYYLFGLFVCFINSLFLLINLEASLSMPMVKLGYFLDHFKRPIFSEPLNMPKTDHNDQPSTVRHPVLWSIFKLYYLMNQFAQQKIYIQPIARQLKLSNKIRPSSTLLINSPNQFNSTVNQIKNRIRESSHLCLHIDYLSNPNDDFKRLNSDQLNNHDSVLSYNDVKWRNSTSRFSYWFSILFILLSLTCSVRGTATKRNAEKKILDSIIGQGKYDSRIRPSGINNTLEKDGPCIVNVNIFVRSIGKISDLDMEYSIQITFREQWNDSRLEFNSVNNITYLTLTEPEKIWKPDLFFSNEKEGHFHNIIMPNVLLRIYPNGQVLYSIRISLVLSCPMNLKYYPLDKQVCQIKMGSYGYTTEDLIFYWKSKDPVQVTSALNLPTFSLYKHVTDYCTSRTNTGEYSCIYVDLIFKREFSYYLIQIYIPNSMLVIVSWVSFWLDPNAIPARVSLGVTTLLTMATQISGINASLPPVSYIKAIDVWTGVCLTFVFGALLEFALVNYASRSDNHKKQRQAQEIANRKGNPMLGRGGQMNMFNPAMLPNNTNNTIGPLTNYGMTNAMGPLGMTGSNRMSNFANNIDSKPMKHVLAPPRMTAINDYPDLQTLSYDIPLDRPSYPVIMPQQRMGRPNDMRSCEVTINPPYSSSNYLMRWLHSFPSRSKRIDVVSRFIFPTMFGCFNVVYWAVYLLRDKIDKGK